MRILVEEARLLVEVRDSGVGISAENQRRLFNDVVQFHAKAHQGGGGSGLGLWISKKIVDMHGGSIGVRSEGESRGSTFYFTLPIVPVCDEFESHPATRGPSEPLTSDLGEIKSDLILDPLFPSFKHPLGLPPKAQISPEVDAPKALNTTAGKGGTEAGLVNMKVLVVDDSALNRKMMVNRLERLGCSTFVADDGDTAVALVQQTLGTNEQYDVITMDNVRA